MNERIRELAKQSGLWFVTPREDLMDDFAELLVKDCISQIAMIGLSNVDNNDVSWTVDLAILNIKEHFGV